MRNVFTFASLLASVSGESDVLADESLSLLQTAAAKAAKHPHGHLSMLNTRRAGVVSNSTVSTRYIHGNLDSINLRTIMEEHDDIPDNDEDPMEFGKEIRQRQRSANIEGDWVLSTMRYNNLGGQGPDSGTEGIRYANVIQMNDRNVDLIVNALTPYERFHRSTNGLNGRVGKINLYHERDVDLRFSFVDAQTDAPVTMGAFTLSVFDLDEGPDGTAKETVTAGGFTSDYMMDFTSLRTADLPDGRRQYSSTTHGRGTNNPSDPFDLTEVAAAHTVSLDYPEGLTEFTLNYAVTKAADKELRPDYMGRNFLFAGASSLYYCNKEPVSLTFDQSTVEYSNLGGVGPDYNSPEGVKYSGVASYNGRPIDLTINAVGDYHAFKATQNGKNGKYALINMMRNTEATFDFSLTDQASGTPVAIDALYFSVLDLDEGKRMKLREGVSVEGFASSYLTEDTEIKMTTQGNGVVRYESSMPGTGKDNPKDPEALTERQKNRAATFLFDRADNWRVHLYVGAGPPSGRNFMFAGKSSVVFC
jgi:hypothetical protein